jgi:hypothetical protein
VGASCEKVVAKVNKKMPVDALGLFDAADDSSKDSSRRKRPYLNSDTNALLGNVLYPKEEEESAKRQKTDCVATRKLNADQWDTMFLRLAAYKAEKGVSGRIESF